jgi:SAM-dependent methyltransferase
MNETNERLGDPEAAPLQGLAAKQAKVWEGSSYYDDAEKWTHLFWEPETQFRNKFDKLDLTCVVELACGHGRHAAVLAKERKVLKYIGLDVLQENVDFSQDRLKDHHNFSFFPVDGTKFNPVANGVASAIFCYDAMVHFDSQVVLSYLADAGRILKKKGRALFHHSNLYTNPASPYSQNPHARAFMSLDLFHHYATRAGLSVIEAMPLRWANYSNLDGLTLVEKL